MIFTSLRTRFLKPKRPDVLALLLTQLQLTGAVSQIVASRIEGTANRALREELDAISAHHEIVAAQAERTIDRLIVNRLDPEDLARLSRTILEVSRNFADFVGECDMFEARDVPLCGSPAAAASRGVEQLRIALVAVQDGRSARGDASLVVESARSVRHLYQRSLAALLRDPIDATTLRHRELLRRLDIVGLRLAESGGCLLDALRKRGMA